MTADDEHEDRRGPDAGGPDDRPTRELDDLADRDELRRRYYGLLQELRVLLPGVQILVAFLLTAPFANGFQRVDQQGQYLYGLALASGTLAIIVFVAPTVFHRVGHRRSRVARLLWGVRMLRAGLVFLGISLVSAVTLIWSFVFGGGPAVVAAVATSVAMLAIWVVLPRETQKPQRRRDG